MLDEAHFMTSLCQNRRGFGYVAGLTFCLIGVLLYATNATDAEL
jgi:hypothetical protein